MSAIVKTIEKPRLSVKAQTLSAVAAVIASVVLPQIFHAVGAVSGLGSALGEAFLPMHLPIILVGLLAGPYAGAVSGLLAPLISFALSGMPAITMLAFMMIELCAYGLFAGLFRTSGMPTLVKVLSVQIIGRAIRAAAILFAVYMLKNESINVSVIWMSISKGLFGLCLQWALIPLAVYRIEAIKRNEK